MSRLSCNKLRISYGPALAVADFSLAIEPGTSHCLLGPNGAGKSSVLKALYGTIPVTGSVHLDDVDVSAEWASDRARRGIGFVPEGRQIFPRLTVEDNLRVMATLLKLDGSHVERALERFPILVTRRRILAGLLSGGEQQMLAVTRALMCEPKVLLLDEVATGLAAKIVADFLEVVSELKAAGTTIILAEPMLARVGNIVDEGTVIVRGEIFGTASDAAGLERLYSDALGMLTEGPVSSVM